MSDEIIVVNDSPFDFDGIWKEFIRCFWPEILRVCVPSLYDAADIERGAEFLDKEMQEISKQLDESEDESSSRRYVDNLLKIYLKNGSEEWVLLHVEVQGKGGEMISLRMFRYSCLIFLRYGRHPSALAILTAKRPQKEGNPEIYRYDIFGTTLQYRYPVLKTYEYDDEELLADESPVYLFIYAVKKTAEYRNYDDEKRKYMREILKLLKQRGFGPNDRKNFLRVLDFLMANSKRKYRELFVEDRMEIMEERKMGLKTFEEEIWDEAEAEGRKKERSELIRSLVESGTLTVEQISAATGQTVELKTLDEEIWNEAEAEGRNKERNEIIRYLIASGLFTIEQIAAATGQTIEYIQSLRLATE